MFFSIIIPIYNVARFIHSGLHCISEQTFADYEVILVDDGSTDNSPILCDEAAAVDDRIKVIHSENLGSGPARNKGIDAAQGDYLLFFDIDDVLHENALEIIHNRIKQFSNPDLLVFSYREIDVAYNTTANYLFNPNFFNSNEELRRNYVEELSGVRFNNGFVWNKAYSREFIIDKNIRFEALRIQQDEVFNIEVYKNVDTVAVVNDILYDYYVYSSGNTRSRFIHDRLAIYQRVRDSLLSLNAKWHLDDARFTNYIHKRYINSVITYLNFNIYHVDNPGTLSDKHSELFKVVKSAEVRLSVGHLKQEDIIGPLLIRRLYFLSLKKSSPLLYLTARKLDLSLTKSKFLIKNILSSCQSRG